MSVSVVLVSALAGSKVSISQLLQDMKEGDAVYVLDDRTGEGWTILPGVIKLGVTKTKSSAKKARKK